MTDKEYQEFIEEYGDISNYIKDKIDKYRNKEEKLQNELKILFFIYLLNKADSEDFNNKMYKYIKEVEIAQNGAINREIEKIEKIVIKENNKLVEKYKNFKIKDVDIKLYDIDSSSVKNARNSYIKILKNYYKSALDTIKKDFVNEEEYLSKKVTQYDKITKVVPYYNKKTGDIQSYHSYASYNSMIENTHLTRSALNTTIKQVGEMGNDLVYVIPHMLSCPMCMHYQGKVLSISGDSFIYPSLESAIDDGLLHPNCTHELVGYWSEEQKLSNNYDSEKWEEKYKTSQKINAINREIEKLKTDKTIYNKLNNQEKVDDCNSKLKNLYAKRRELKS